MKFIDKLMKILELIIEFLFLIFTGLAVIAGIICVVVLFYRKPSKVTTVYYYDSNNIVESTELEENQEIQNVVQENQIENTTAEPIEQNIQEITQPAIEIPKVETTQSITKTPEIDYKSQSIGKVLIPKLNINATIKNATFTPYTVQDVIDQGYAAYYSDYANVGRSVYAGHNYGCFVGLSNISIGDKVYVDGTEYSVQDKITGKYDDWTPILSNTGVILQTCISSVDNIYIICK